MSQTHLAQLLAYALPAVIVIAAIEGLVMTFLLRRAYDWRAFSASAAVALIGHYLVGLIVPFSLAAPAIRWAATHPLWRWNLGTPAAFLMLFLGLEFCYYWYHRASHRIRWFWATHAVHHSPNHIDFAAAFRLGWTGRLTGTMLFFVPLIWLGFPPAAVFAALSLNLLYQFWLHSEWMPRLGWLEYVLNTPSHHRVHHASNPEYLDVNYGGVLIVFDRLFGTFVAERDDLPCRYGLVHPLISNNPFKIALNEWAAMLRDLSGARSFGEVWHYLFGLPGWQPTEMVVSPAASEALPQPR